MIYLIIILLIVGAWQTFMNGTYSPIISGICLWGAGILIIIKIILWIFKIILTI